MEKIPEKFLNKDGTLNTDALMKSYRELEKKIGTMITVPTESDDDDARARFRHAIGVPDNASDYPTSEMFLDADSVREKFLEIGLTPTQVSKIYDMANEYLSPVIENLFDVQNEKSAITELKNFFGGDIQMQDALRKINTFGEKFLPRDAFDELCATPQGICSVYKMMQSMEPDVQTQKNVAENLTDADLRHMMQSPKYWRDHDAEYVRKIENGFKKLYS